MGTIGDIRTRFEIAMNEAKKVVWKETMKKAIYYVIGFTFTLTVFVTLIMMMLHQWAISGI